MQLEAMANRKKHSGSGKRKEREEEQEYIVKRMRVDEGTTNGGVEETNPTINETLPPELLSIIVGFAGESATRVMWVVGRLVCRVWKNLFPSSEEFKKRLGQYRKQEHRLSSQIAEQGWISLLLWVNRVYPSGIERILDAAAKYGHLDLLKKLKEENNNQGFHVTRLLVRAAKGGHLEVLRWLQELGDSFSAITQVAFKAIGKGHLEVVKYLRSQYARRFKVPEGVSKKAVQKGHLEMVKWLIEEYALFVHHGQNCVDAAETGQLEMLKWMKERGFSLNQWVCLTAARNGHLDVLKWARENGAPWDLQSCAGQRYSSREMVSIASVGQLGVLRYAIENGGTFHPDTCKDAAEKGFLEVLKFARENGASWNQEVCEWAAVNGDLPMLKWARENGAPWDHSTCINAAMEGHFDVLKWARENGASWNQEVCEWAATNREFEMLKWVRGQGCPWSKSTLAVAADQPKRKMLKWVLLNGQWDKADLQSAGKKAGWEIFRWMLDHQDVLHAIKLCGEKIVNAAVKSWGSQAALDRCEQEGFEFDEYTWNLAAKWDSVESAKWLRKKLIPCDTDEFLEVAMANQSYAVLRWACGFIQGTPTNQPEKEE